MVILSSSFADLSSIKGSPDRRPVKRPSILEIIGAGIEKTVHSSCLETVKKDYPLGKTIVQAIKGVDLLIDEGDLVSIVGPSGSGKTTLLNIIGCIDQATAGSVKIQNEEITTLNDKTLTNLRLHRIGFIFQTFNLIPVLNVRENVEFPLLMMKKTKQTSRAIRERAEELIDAVGLKDQITQSI